MSSDNKITQDELVALFGDEELRKLIEVSYKAHHPGSTPPKDFIDACMMFIATHDARKRQADRVTRFEVIDHRDHESDSFGRVFVAHGVNIELSYQNNDQTLKVFVMKPAQVYGSKGTS